MTPAAQTAETKHDAESAFPVSTIDGFTQHGMSLRDWFAGQALAGMCAFHGTYGGTNGVGDNAQRAYQQADAMLAARGAQS